MAIIGISGRIGSGKDTVGQIIQYLTDELNKANPKEFTEWVDGGFHASDWRVMKFAGKLKQIASILTGATLEQLEDQDFKKQYMGESWRKLTGAMSEQGLGELMTYRELLQKLGTEAMRNVIHENVWVNALMADYIPNCDKFESKMLQTGGNYTSSICSNCNCFPNWIITDMRFPNEMDAVKARGGITIRVNRPKAKISTGDSVTDFVLNETKNFGIVEHPSETALDNHKFDFVIDNSNSISDLIDKVKDILTLNKII